MTATQAQRTLDVINKLRSEPFRRTYEVRSQTVNADARTVELAFSSEYEVQRWYGIEILGHEKGEVRMDRLRSGAAAVLVNHDIDDQVGVVDSAEIDSDGMGRAVTRFGKSARAEEIFQDVKDEIRQLVSVGYRIYGVKLVETRSDGTDVYRITDWEPYEISLVSVPADPTVGVGRAAENVQVEPRAQSAETPTHNEQTHEGPRMSAPAQEQPVDVNAARKAATEEANARAATLLQMGEQYKALDLAAQFVREGKSVAEFQLALIKRLDEKTSKPVSEQMKIADIGLTDKEAKRFSFMRAIRYLAEPRNEEAREAAGFELECSRAAQKSYGKNARGILVPNDVLTRAFGTTTPSGAAGSNIVATELLAGSFIDILRNRTWVMKRARKLAGLVGNVDIPRQKQATTTYWVGEGTAPTTSDMGVDQIALTPHTLGAFSDITRRLLMQSTPDAEALVRDDLVKTMALAIDLAAIYGSGASNQPLGVKNQSGIEAVTFAGANPTFAELVSMETAVANANADIGSLAYVADAAFRGYAKGTLKFAVNGASTIWEPGNTVNGYECEISNQITAGDVFFGNWDDLLVALWSGLDLTVDPYALSTSGGLRVITFQDLDFQVRHPQSFCYGVL